MRAIWAIHRAMDVRPLLPADAAALVPLVAGLAAHHGEPATTTEATLSRDLSDGWIWRFGTGAPLSGYALLFPHARASVGLRGAVLHHIYVTPKARRRGVARALLQAAEADAAAWACTYLQIGTHAGNDAVRATYVALGYTFSAPTFWKFRKPFPASGCISSTSLPSSTSV